MSPLRPFSRNLRVTCPRHLTVRHFAASTRCNMPSNDPNAKNASGLTPSETKGLRERQPEASEEKILEGIKEVRARRSISQLRLMMSPLKLYSSKPTEVGHLATVESARNQNEASVIAHLRDICAGRGLPRSRRHR